MRNILYFLFTLISFAADAQMNTFGGIGLRVNDTTTYQTNAAAYHSAGYRDLYFNNQATSKHWDIWNGSSYDHIFSFAGAGGAGLSDGDYGDITVGGDGTSMTVDNTAITYAKFQNLTGLSIFGRSANSSGVGADITAGSDGNILFRNGTSLTFGSPPASSIANTAAGTISSTNIQNAVNELDTEKAPYRTFTLSGTFTDQPAYSASAGYYLMYPETSGVIPRVYINPNTPSGDGTRWKLEGFHTDYLSGSTNYAGFNIFGSTSSSVHTTWIGPNRGGSGTRGVMTIGAFTGSSQDANSSELTMNTNNTWTWKGSGFNYQSVAGTNHFGINGNGAILLGSGSSAGTSGYVLTTAGSGGPASWQPSQVISSASTSTAGSTITLNMNSLTQLIHVGSATFATAKTIAMSNTSNALAFSFIFEVTNVAAVLTPPSDWVMTTTDFDGTDWTPPATGRYKFSGTFNGTDWYVNANGPYN